jgi:DNA-binding MarR family transcriptional regulator
MDDVDRLIEALRKEVPRMDVEPLNVVGRVMRLARHLELDRRNVLAEVDLEPWEYDVLEALRGAGKPYQMSPGDLMQAMLVASGTMTNRIDRLARRGFVTREPDPNDGRGVLVRLTAGGRKRADQALVAVSRHEAESVGALAERKRTQLVNTLRELVGQFDQPES